MPSPLRSTFTASLLVLTAGVARTAETWVIDAPAALPAVEIATPPDLPAVGKWMFDKDGSIAHWLGQHVDGKHLHEPINVILVDAASASADEARQSLVEAATKAGYPVRFGHSAGYRGYIAGALYSQLPQGRDDAISNRIFEETNNHGRIFGPYAHDGTFVFVGAFSRERVDLLRWPGHRYASFDQARTDFAHALVERSSFSEVGMVPLDNQIADNSEVTTGDHDGRAVVLRRTVAPSMYQRGTP